MYRSIVSVLLVSAALVVGGCEETRKFIGVDRDPPDEFAVYSRAPLSLPPDYALRPPEPGASRPQQVNPVDNAKKAVVGDVAMSTPAPGEVDSGTAALLKEIGAYKTDPGIRVTVNRETMALAEEEKSVADTIIFWRPPVDPSVVVDPAKEAKRVNEAQALGKPVTDGETAVIERKRRGLLEGLF